MISNNHRLFSSIGAFHVLFILQKVCYSLDGGLKRDITSWMIATLFSNNRNSNFGLLNLLAREHLSPVRIFGCYSLFAELLSYEKLSKHLFLELKHKKTLRRVKIVL
jgi:hypothetical protein